jgi:drug/metabolite transporter (DMT)-like permease
MKSSSTSWLAPFLAVALTWGSSFLLVKLIIDEFSPLGITFFRSVAGAIVLLAIVARKRLALPRTANHLFHIGVVSLLLGVAPTLMVSFGAKGISSSVGGVLSASIPTATVIATLTFFPSQRATRNQMLGVAMGLIGIALISEVITGVGSNEPRSILLVLAATMCYGIGLPYSKRYVLTMPYSSYALVATQVLLAAVLLLPFTLFFRTTVGTVTASGIGYMLMLGIFGSGFAFVWNFRVVELAGSTIASSVAYLTPIVAAVLGFVVLDETLTILQVVGIGIVVVSSAVVQERIRLIAS